MLQLTLAALVAASLVGPVGAPEGASAAALRDPRTQPLTAEDAIYTIPDVAGRIALVGDLDGDGRADLVALRGRAHPLPDTPPLRLDAVSSRDGSTIRTLWTAPPLVRTSIPRGLATVERVHHVTFAWDAGGDVDGDGVSDVVIGLPEDGRNGKNAGGVVVVSGASGDVVHASHGARAGDHDGWAVAFVGDVDGDGMDDYAVGAPACDPRVLPVDERPVRGHMTSSSGDNVVLFQDGSRVDQAVLWQELLGRRSGREGVVRVCSGRTGTELARFAGGRPGHAFGARLCAGPDADGDGRADLMVASDVRSSDPIVIVSCATGDVLRELDSNGGPFGVAGDVDGDGVDDLFLDRMDPMRSGTVGKVDIVTRKRSKAAFDLTYPDMWSEYAITIPLGDVDGDGADDLLLGDGNFHVPGPGNGGPPDLVAPDLRAMTLWEALALESAPWCAFSYESGAAWVYSGRTRRVIMGVWGRPGSMQGMGLGGAPIPDLDGDGWPEIAVVDGGSAHVFRGPGPAPAGALTR